MPLNIPQPTTLHLSEQIIDSGFARPRHSFTCHDSGGGGGGTCVDQARVCDGVNDCDDSSDEAQCGFCRKFDQFTCEDGSCVDARRRCDGVFDCLDGSDEYDNYCDASKRDDSLFYCCTTLHVVGMEQTCDGIIDCLGDASDETLEGQSIDCILDVEAQSSCSCKPDCTRVLYDIAHESSEWPSLISLLPLMSTLNKSLSGPGETLLRKITTRYSQDDLGEALALVRSTFNRVNIYIGLMETVYHTERPVYDMVTILSTIGGLLGLYLGISVMTLFEIIDLLTHLLFAMSTKQRYLKSRSQERSSVKDQADITVSQEEEAEVWQGAPQDCQEEIDESSGVQLLRFTPTKQSDNGDTGKKLFKCIWSRPSPNNQYYNDDYELSQIN